MKITLNKDKALKTGEYGSKEHTPLFIISNMICGLTIIPWTMTTIIMFISWEGLNTDYIRWTIIVLTITTLYLLTFFKITNKHE